MKILPLFLPYCGCKTRCIFCNQEILNGNELIFDKHEIPSILKNSISGIGDDFQIAFFGGTFTVPL
jgi:histone acetyltransferase (RNA polymerase elongator complex component)